MEITFQMPGKGSALLSGSAVMTKFDVVGRIMVIDFLNGFFNRDIKEAIAKHMFFGSQNMIVIDNEGGRHAMVVCPQSRNDTKDGDIQIRYRISAHTKDTEES